MISPALYKYASLFLLLLNLFWLGFFLFNPGPPPPKDASKINASSARAMLQLSETQDAQFIESAERHKAQVKAIHADRTQTLRAYFTSLTKPGDVDSLLERAVDLERQQIQFTYGHLQEVKDLLAPQQEADFEDFIQHILRVTVPEPKK